MESRLWLNVMQSVSPNEDVLENTFGLLSVVGLYFQAKKLVDSEVDNYSLK